MNAYANHYQRNQVLNAAPEQILVMLYDGAIRFVRQAMQAMENEDVSARVTAIRKALAIVTEFSNTLDFEAGGEIAHDLNRLYDFMSTELIAVNVNGDRARLEPVENILCELREAWVEAAQVVAREKQSTAVEATGNGIVATL